MKLLIRLAIILAFLMLGLYALAYANDREWLKNSPFGLFQLAKPPQLGQDAWEQTQILGERAKETTQHVQRVLGETVKIDQEGSRAQKEKAIHEKTLEYAQYLYCQQVVTDWEKTHQ